MPGGRFETKGGDGVSPCQDSRPFTELQAGSTRLQSCGADMLLEQSSERKKSAIEVVSPTPAAGG